MEGFGERMVDDSETAMGTLILSDVLRMGALAVAAEHLGPGLGHGNGHSLASTELGCTPVQGERGADDEPTFMAKAEDLSVS